MEETNYDRRSTQVVPTSSTGSSVEAVGIPDNNEITEKPATLKGSEYNDKSANIGNLTVEVGQVTYPRKTYLQKLGFKDKKRPNRILDVMWAPFKFFTFPVVVWSGILYGTNGEFCNKSLA